MCDLRSLFEIMITEFSNEIPLIFLDKEDNSLYKENNSLDKEDNSSVSVTSQKTSIDANRPLYENLVNKSKQVFTCGICQHVIKPPAILATCCGQIIGCDTCIKEMTANNWNRRCPLCRKASPELRPINGLDEFIDGMNDIPDSD